MEAASLLPYMSSFDLLFYCFFLFRGSCILVVRHSVSSTAHVLRPHAKRLARVPFGEGAMSDTGDRKVYREHKAIGV